MRRRISFKVFCVIAGIAPLLFQATAIQAQEQPPDLHAPDLHAPDLQMLLNLDLFGQAAAAHDGGGQTQDPQPDPQSLLDQIRTLNSMGYLGGQVGSQAPPVGGPADSSEPRSQDDEETE